MDFLSHRALDNNLPRSHNTLLGRVHSRFYSKQRRLVRSAVKFSLHLPSQITPPSPVNDANVFRPFSQELIWIGESCYPKIMVSGLILKIRSEDTLLSLRKDVFHCLFSHQVFCLSSRTIDERFQIMVISVCWLTTKCTLLLLTHFRKTKYADWLRSIFCSYLLSFGKVIRYFDANSDSWACAVVTKPHTHTHIA